MIALSKAAETLKARFEAPVQMAYVPGKTLFRDTLCEALDASVADAEMLCDSLERAGALRFEKSSETGPSWIVDPERVQGS